MFAMPKKTFSLVGLLLKYITNFTEFLEVQQKKMRIYAHFPVRRHLPQQKKTKQSNDVIERRK